MYKSLLSSTLFLQPHLPCHAPARNYLGFMYKIIFLYKFLPEYVYIVEIKTVFGGRGEKGYSDVFVFFFVFLAREVFSSFALTALLVK